jgi:integrase
MARYKKNGGTRVLTDDEIRKIWVATEPDEKAQKPFCAFVRFLLLTGARRNEARGLARTEIDGADWLLPAVRNKTKQPLIRPLSKAAQAVLAEQAQIDGGPLVFTTDGHRALSVSKPKVAFDAACGVTGWKLHDLRRTSRTLLSRAGVNADIAERCLGHVIGGVRGVYDRHSFHDEMAHAFEALSQQIERIINPVDNVTPLRRKR